MVEATRKRLLFMQFRRPNDVFVRDGNPGVIRMGAAPAGAAAAAAVAEVVAQMPRCVATPWQERHHTTVMMRMRRRTETRTLHLHRSRESS